jgi:hypothetical protein
MYKDSSLFAGSMESGEVYNWGYNDNYYPNNVLSEWTRDVENEKVMFKFTQKYGIDVDKWFRNDFHK